MEVIDDIANIPDVFGIYVLPDRSFKLFSQQEDEGIKFDNDFTLTVMGRLLASNKPNVFIKKAVEIEPTHTNMLCVVDYDKKVVKCDEMRR